MLDVAGNSIDDIGVQYVGKALEKNTVRSIVHCFILFTCLTLNVDT